MIGKWAGLDAGCAIFKEFAEGMDGGPGNRKQKAAHKGKRRILAARQFGGE